MKYLYLLFALLFTYFTYVQFNDADGPIWILLYGYIAVLFVLAFLGKFYKQVLWVGIGICAIGALFHINALYEFITNTDGIGFSQGMSNEQPYIERSREFGGLVIGGLSLWFLFRQMRKDQA